MYRHCLVVYLSRTAHRPRRQALCLQRLKPGSLVDGAHEGGVVCDVAHMRLLWACCSKSSSLCATKGASNGLWHGLRSNNSPTASSQLGCLGPEVPVAAAQCWMQTAQFQMLTANHCFGPTLRPGAKHHRTRWRKCLESRLNSELSTTPSRNMTQPCPARILMYTSRTLFGHVESERSRCYPAVSLPVFRLMTHLVGEDIVSMPVPGPPPS